MLMLFECSITPDILQHRDELSKFIGEEIARTLTEQKNLERRYEQLIEQRAAMKGMVNKVKYKEIKDEIQEVLEGFHQPFGAQLERKSQHIGKPYQSTARSQ